MTDPFGSNPEPELPTTWEVGQRVTVRFTNGNTVTMPATADKSSTDPNTYLDAGWVLWEVSEYPEPLRSRLKGFREGTIAVPLRDTEELPNYDQIDWRLK